MDEKHCDNVERKADERDFYEAPGEEAAANSSLADNCLRFFLCALVAFCIGFVWHEGYQSYAIGFIVLIILFRKEKKDDNR